MIPNLYLIVHNVISIASVVALFGLTFFTFLNGPKKVANIAFSLVLVSANVFVISHVIGVNIADPGLSKSILMFNLSVFFIGAFFLHAILAIIGKDREKWWMITFVYFSSAILVILLSVFSDLFLQPSVPKMYFPNYYNPGELGFVRMLFLYVVIVPYSIHLLYLSYKAEANLKRQQQYKYFIIASLVGFGIGFIPNFLVHDIQINPLWGMLFAIIFTVPFVYNAVWYEMFDIRVIAKHAFFYSIFVGIVGGLITLLNYSNKWIQLFYPSLTETQWITALISAVLTVTIGVMVWKQLRKDDLLKYEFITIIIHKFRTPVTQIRWSIEALRSEETNLDKIASLNDMENSSKKLIDLTSALIELSNPDNPSNSLGYFEKISLRVLLKTVTDSFQDAFSKKQITLSLNLPVSDIFVNVDKERVKFVIQTLLENALAYTPSNGKVSLSLELVSDKAVVSVIDNGIGIKKDDLGMIFTRFFRTEKAKTTDTEGFGIGLYLARLVARRHKGDIKVYSEGEEKGTSFKFTLPKA